MNEQFETLPFAAAEMEGEMEQERGRGRGAYRGGYRGGGMPARQRASNRPQGRAPGAWKSPARAPRRPGYGPRYGPYGPAYWPAPYAFGVGPWPYGAAGPEQPADEPPDDAAPFDDGASEVQGEEPATLSATLARLPAAQRPVYQPLGPIAGAIGDPRARGAGLYLIEFTSGGRRRAYSGQSADLRTRLQQHALCGRMMGLDMAGHLVYVAPLSAEAQRRALEKRIHDDMLRHHAGVLTNQRRELEFEAESESEAERGHGGDCRCPACGGAGSFEVMAFGRGARQPPLGEADEMELAMELLSVSSEAEMDQFLGKVFKSAWKGIKKVAAPLGGALKAVAKTALPFVGGALGSFIPIPGVGTALGTALGGALSKAMELELEGLDIGQREFEMARRFVRFADGAARRAADGDGSPAAVQSALRQTLRTLQAPRPSGPVAGEAW